MLGTTFGQPEANVVELEAPFDILLLLEVMAETPDGAGAYTLRAERLSN